MNNPVSNTHTKQLNYIYLLQRTNNKTNVRITTLAETDVTIVMTFSDEPVIKSSNRKMFFWFTDQRPEIVVGPSKKITSLKSILST